jgi:hypothetical protein
MNELAIDATLVGRKVCVPARSDWGAGTVLKVLSTTVNGAAQQRVTVQFAHATRTLLVPPARLDWPQDEPQRAAAGWIGSIGGGSLDERLRRVPEEILQVLGGIRTRLAAVYPLYAFSDEPKSVQKWARLQTGVGDPLGQWSRDELSVAFEAYCSERDAHLRNLAALLVKAEGREALAGELAGLEREVRERVEGALRRVV